MSPYHMRRKDDTPENVVAWRREVRRGRARIVAMSVIAAGAVSLFIGNAVETAAYNDQIPKLRAQCEAIYRDRATLRAVAGDVASQTRDHQVRERWSGYESIFRHELPPFTATCKELHPKRSYLPFVE